MKQLPKNLQTFILDLQYNDLEGNSEQMNWLGEGLKYLPNNLKILELYLSSNNIGI